MALVNPHGGGKLKPLLLEGQALKDEQARAKTLPQLKVTSREAGDIIMMGIGGFTPLDGFMTHADWQGVCDGMKMANGLFWPIPITLSTDQVTADGIKTVVANCCGGIDEKSLPFIFERFFRAERSRSRNDGGAGIGLAIVKELIEAHGGHVGAESDTAWTRVWFTLPSPVHPLP